VRRRGGRAFVLLDSAAGPPSEASRLLVPIRFQVPERTRVTLRVCYVDLGRSRAAASGSTPMRERMLVAVVATTGCSPLKAAFQTATKVGDGLPK
jgi:hypothetical protein